MKAVLIYCGTNDKHKDFLKMFLEETDDMLQTLSLDIAGEGKPYEKYLEIRKAEPEFILTLDLAGMELRTEMETATLNQIPVRMAHILLEDTVALAQWLGELFNFSMFFYGTETLCRKLEEQYPELPNKRKIPDILKMKDDGRKNWLKGWLRDFFQEAELVMR